jgi:hypothetical protein
MARPMSLEAFVASNASKDGGGFVDTARLIAGEDPPRWLAKHLQRWSSSIMLDGNVLATQAGRAEIRARLKQLGEDTELVERELREQVISDLLWAEPLGPVPHGQHPITVLQEISRRSVVTLSSNPGLSEEMRARLQKLKRSAELAARELQDSTISEFLQAEERASLPPTIDLSTYLKDLRNRADASLSSSHLATKSGKTKAGRSRGLPPNASSPRGFCAAVILEAWAYFHDGKYPATSNMKLAAAADEYWRASGGGIRSWGDDPLKAWRPYFVEASQPSLTDIRRELRRHINLSAEKHNLRQ